MIAKRILIEQSGENGNHFDVVVDGVVADMLCWEEMLGQIATITHPDIKKPRFQMKPLDQRGDPYGSEK